MHDSEIVHHNPCLNLFILHNNSFHNQGGEINKNDIFYVSTYYLLQNRSCYYTFNKYTSCYHSSCLWVRLKTHQYVLNPWEWKEIHNIVLIVSTLKMIIIMITE